MNWNEFYKVVADHKGRILDLSTGSPLLIPEVSHALRKTLKEISSHVNLPEEFGKYGNYYGIPPLIESFVYRCSKDFNCNLKPEQILVIPGAHVALRFIQELVRQNRKRILYPFNLEYPGAVDYQSTKLPSIGRYLSIKVAKGICRLTLQLESFNWKDVGAVIVSRPHNPTGCVLTKKEVEKIASRAAKNKALLVLDETYALPFAPLCIDFLPVHAPNIVHIYSFSKVGLAGERVGIIVSPIEIAQKLQRILIDNIIQTPKSSQYLALSLVTLFKKHKRLSTCSKELILKRWVYCKDVLESSGILNQGIKIAIWQGGGFLWCEWQDSPKSDEVFLTLLKSGIVVVPESCLMVNNNSSNRVEGIRISLGISLKDLKVGIKTIAQILSKRR